MSQARSVRRTRRRKRKKNTTVGVVTFLVEWFSYATLSAFLLTLTPYYYVLRPFISRPFCLLFVCVVRANLDASYSWYEAVASPTSKLTR